MSLRPKTKRRLLILIGVSLLLGAGLFWMVRGPRARDAAKAAELRRVGMELYARGDHAAAMPKLSEYLTLSKVNQKQPTPDELEALYAFGDCRWRIPMPRFAHLKEASDRIKMYLDHRPADARALRTQADLMTRMGRFADAVAAADQVLAQQPDDRDALYHRAFGLYRQPKPDLAAVQKAVDRLLARDPGHVRGQMLGQQVRLQAGASPADLIGRAEKLAAAHPDDPRFQLVAARTYMSLAAAEPGRQDPARRAEWEKQARGRLQKAAARPPADPEFAAQVLDALDRNGMFVDAIWYLRRATDQLAAGDEELERSLARRLWQNGGYAEVIDRTAKLDPRDPRADAHRLAYRGLSLQARAAMPSAADARTRLLNDADAILTALAARTDAPEAQGWAAVLRAGVDPAAGGGATRRTVGEQAALFRQAREKDPDNAVAAARLGDAYAAQGETEPAVQMWDVAARLRPDWGYPHARVAKARLDEGRAAEAEPRAAAAWFRWPNNPPFVSLILESRYANLGKDPKPAALEALLVDVDKMQQIAPNDPGTLPLQVTLLARLRGTGPAAARVAAALAAKPPLPLDALLRLRAADDAHKLGQAAAIDAALAKHQGADLAIAARRASDLLAQGSGAEGLKVLREARAKAKGEADPRWMLVVAAHLDQMNDPSAAKAWAELGEREARDLYYQSQILKGNARLRDRDLWAKTIERVRGLTGDEGTLWKTERARYLLADPAAGSKERAEAITLLTELTQRGGDAVEAHRLLGAALARDGKPDRAADALAVAFSKAPARADVGLELVQALRAVNNGRDALARAKEVAALPSLTAEQRVRVAGHLEDLGQPGRAVALLLAAPEGGERDARLGRLYRATGQPAEAAAAYKRVLNDPSARPGDVFAGADFFAAAGDAASTKLFLDRLRTMPQSVAVTQMLLGQFNEVYGSPDQARTHLTRATELAPKDPLTWRALTGFLVRARQYNDAAKAVDAGLAATAPPATAGAAGAAADPELTALKPLVATVRALIDVEAVRPLVDYLTRDPSNPAANDMLRALADGQAAAAAAPAAERAAVEAQTYERLAKLADQHPGFWPLQEEVIRYHLSTNRAERAAELADRATPAFPGNDAPPRYAAAAHTALGRWDKVVEAATVWRQRAPGDPVPADIALAGAMIGKQQRLIAAQTLEPHVRANPLPTGGDAAAGTTRPALKPYALSLYRTYGRALIGAARPTDAAERLKPLLSLGTQGRLVWLGLANAHTREDQAKQWVERAVEAMGPDAPPAERLALADAWFQAGRATGSAALLKRAAEVLEPMAAAAAKPGRDVLVLSAFVAHFGGDYATAERYWRAVRAQAPSPDVSNNLAYALLLGGRPDAVAEARTLADEAVAAYPQNPEFLGTQARAMARQGQRDEAIGAFRQALARDGRSVEAMVGLAEELAKGSTPEKDEARKLLTRAREVVAEDPQPVAPEMKRQLEAVRALVETADGK